MQGKSMNLSKKDICNIIVICITEITLMKIFDCTNLCHYFFRRSHINPVINPMIYFPLFIHLCCHSKCHQKCYQNVIQNVIQNVVHSTLFYTFVKL